MTVIAYKAGILAADRQTSMHNNPTTKVRRMKNGDLVGGCGSAAGVLALLDAMDAPVGATRNTAELMKDYKGDDLVSGILVRKADGKVFSCEWPFTHNIPIELPFFALGSGREYAMGAMAAGKSAQQAIEITSMYESNCGGGVDYLHLCGETA
jgi:ATP-dependent protease HslVU (ClpYQ) peptidase subunit